MLDEHVVLEDGDLRVVVLLAHHHLAVDRLATGQELGLGDDRCTATSGLAALAAALLLGLEAGRAGHAGDLVLRGAALADLDHGVVGVVRSGVRVVTGTGAAATATRAAVRTGVVVGVLVLVRPPAGALAAGALATGVLATCALATRPRPPGVLVAGLAVGVAIALATTPSAAAATTTLGGSPVVGVVLGPVEVVLLLVVVVGVVTSRLRARRGESADRCLEHRSGRRCGGRLARRRLLDFGLGRGVVGRGVVAGGVRTGGRRLAGRALARSPGSRSVLVGGGVVVGRLRRGGHGRRGRGRGREAHGRRRSGGATGCAATLGCLRGRALGAGGCVRVVVEHLLSSRVLDRVGRASGVCVTRRADRKLGRFDACGLSLRRATGPAAVSTLWGASRSGAV